MKLSKGGKASHATLAAEKENLQPKNASKIKKGSTHKDRKTNFKKVVKEEKAQPATTIMPAGASSEEGP